MRLIDADALLELWDSMTPRARTEFDQNIMLFPQVEAEPVRRGRWIKMSDADGIFYACSECGEWHKETSNYCPNCGAQTEYVRKPLARALYQV